METALRFSGYFGAVVLLFGIIGGWIVGSYLEHPLLMLHVVLGALCLLAWVVTSGLHSVSRAGQVLSGRTARFGYNVVFYTAVFAGLLIVANVFVSMNDKRWDLTEQGVYSLSEKSVKIVQGLKAPLRMVAIDAPQIADREKTEGVLKLYKYHNDKKVSFELLNAQARPVELDRLGMKPGNLLYLEYGEGSSKSVSRINEIDEQSITNAIVKLTRGAAKKLYYVQGHGEPALDSSTEGGMKQLADALADEHLEIEGLLLAQTGSVPADAAAVILADPQRELQQAERDALVQYAEKGGRLILLGNGENRDSEDVRSIAQVFGIDVGRDVVLDEQLRLFAGPQLAVQFVAQSFGAHPITAGLRQSDPPVFLFASSVTTSQKSTDKVTYSELLKSGPNSWAEKNLKLIFDEEAPTASRDPEDVKGPVSIAVAYEKKLDAPAGESDEGKADSAVRVVVFGDASWLTNGNLMAMGNRDLALNVINWAAGEEGSVAIGAKSMRASVAPIPQATYNRILAFSFLGPELILLFGLFVWWRRKVALA
jgi:ABC-type uncharacterized transport system involved in gliding motility auxiliary subunit